MNQFQINRASLISYIDSQGWNYSVRRDDGDSYIARAGFELGNRLKSVSLFMYADSSCIQSIGVSPVNAGEADYAKVVEYITRANYGLKIGNFEFDYSDGEVRFQSILVSIDGIPNNTNIETAVDMPYHMFKKYGDGLVKALMGFGDPVNDVAAAEA